LYSGLTQLLQYSAIMARKIARRSIKSIELYTSGEKITAGDAVMLRPADNTGSWIAKVVKIQVVNNEDIVLVVQWYYTPEQMQRGRLETVGKNCFFPTTMTKKVRTWCYPSASCTPSAIMKALRMLGRKIICTRLLLGSILPTVSLCIVNARRLTIRLT
jgi:hypothetical protein